MRLYTYINEQKDIEESIREILKECQPFLKDFASFSNKRFLGSGRQGKPYIFRGKVRGGRKPKDTPKEIQEVIDKIFEDVFGVKPRSHSVFCFAGPNRVSEYGEAYMIFPIGKYRTIGSSQVEDLYETLFNLLFHKLGERTLKDWQKLDEVDKEEALDYLKNEFYNNIIKLYSDDFYLKSKKLTYKNEIMLVCKEYAAIHGDYWEKTNHIIEEDL